MEPIHSFTKHGHPCCDLAPVGGLPPRQQPYRCGGPPLCSRCEAEAIFTHELGTRLADHPEPADGTRIEFQEYGIGGGDLIGIHRDDASSAEAGYSTGNGGEVWCEYGRSVPVTWAEVLSDQRLAAARFGKRLGPVATYDSRTDTLIHSQRVGELMVDMVKEALDRSTCHDRSKTLPPEVEIFDEFTPKLKGLTYGTDEYEAARLAMGPALQHHYANNRHHSEHFTNGINGMTLVDLVEMLADWKAATERHDDGDLAKSLEINQKRFGISDQLTQILRNTAEHFGWLQ